MLLYDFGSWVSEHVVIGHAFIDIILNNDHMWVLSHDFCNLIKLFMGEDLAHWIMRRCDYEYLGLLIDGCL
jgi:hypothetical protein